MAIPQRPAAGCLPDPLWSRRRLLQVGAMHVGGSLLPTAAVRAGAEPSGSARSVIVLWMAGGVTHIDSFDPKPDAPEQVRGTLGAIATALPGVRFAECLPELARIADRLAVVRSFSHDGGDHFLSQAYALSGRKVGADGVDTEPNVGSVVSHLKGPRAGLPGYIAVPGTTRPGPPPRNLFVGGWLGQRFAPFGVVGPPREPDFDAAFLGRSGDPPGEFEEDLRPGALTLPEGLDAEALRRRKGLRHALDRALRTADDGGAMDGHYRAAWELLASPRVRRAFDLDDEPERLRAGYGRTKIGRRCLLARRLVEAGARFVLVDYGYDPDYGNLWDNHCVAVQRQPPIGEMALRPYHLAGTDRACAALISDLDARGMLAETLVVFLTEFGRTPRINKEGGRDHWGAAGSIFFAGGGVRGGQVIGATDRLGAHPTGPPHSPADVAASIYRAVGIAPETPLRDLQGRPMAVLPSGESIAGLFTGAGA